MRLGRFASGNAARLFVICALLTSLPAVVAAGIPGPSSVNADDSPATDLVWFVECVDCPRWFEEMTDRSLRIDSSGHPHVVYGGDHLYHAWHDGASWQYEVVDDGRYVGLYAALDLDAADHPHISYHDNINGDLKYAHWTGSQWEIETVDSEGSDVGMYTSIAVDDSGEPHISYYDDSYFPVETYDLKYAHRSASGWHIETVDSAGVAGAYSSLALDGSGHPHISYRGETYLKYARWTGSAWVTETVDYVSARHTSLAIDGTGHAHIAYQDSTARDLKYAHWTGVSWEVETVDDSASYVGEYASLDLDPDGRPHISYRWTPGGFPLGELRLARWSGSAWIIDSIDDGVYMGYYTSVDVDEAGRPHVSYLEDAGNTLKYARWTGSEWATEVVDESSDVGGFNSLQLDSTDRPHISSWSLSRLKHARWTGSEWANEFVDNQVAVAGISLQVDSGDRPHIGFISYDVSHPTLKYAHWTGSEWIVETVSSNYVGYDASLALDTQGRPHIAYPTGYDANDLKYARWTGSTWAIETVPNAGEVGSAVSLALDGNDRAHSCFTTRDGALRYARWTGNTWAVATVDDTGEAEECSLALDSSGHAHIGYDNDQNGNLQYAHWTGSVWTTSTVDTGVYGGISLALDGAGNPHLSYSRNRALKYARWTGSEWFTQFVAGGQGVRYYTSLALDGENNPHISFYDGDNRDLKYAVGRPGLPYTPNVVAPMEQPASGGHVADTFRLSGYAVDLGSFFGTGIDTVHLYLDGPYGTGTIIGGATYGLARPDVATLYGANRFEPSGWEFNWDTGTVSPGAHTIYVYARRTTDGAWSVMPSHSVVVLPELTIRAYMPLVSGP